MHTRAFRDETGASVKGPVLFIHGDTLVLSGGHKKALLWRIANGAKMQSLDHDPQGSIFNVQLL